MEILNIILALIISLLGFPTGLILAKCTEEELKPGRKYFFFMKKIILILTIIFVLYSFHLNLLVFMGIGLILTALSLTFRLNMIKEYMIFLILFIISIKNLNLLVLTSSLIFLYGLSMAALIKK